MNLTLKIALIMAVLMFANSASAYALYDAPTPQETQLFRGLLDQFEKEDVPKKDVSDIIQTFGKPLIISFPCNANDTNNFVVAVVSTRLAKFDETAVREDQVIGGAYTWDCLVTSQADKVTLQCNNEMRLNSNVLLNGTGVDPMVHQVENEVVLYHEFLHGQLMVDSIKSPGPWRHEICNEAPGEQIDYSYADPDHAIINPLQSQFASELMESRGGAVITKYLLPNETRGGSFSTTVLKIGDYPQFRNGGEVTLRAVNMGDTKFGEADNILFLNGTLVNKTEPGVAWFYISNSTAPQHAQSPFWYKRTAGLWAGGHVTDSYFYGILQSMTGAKGGPAGENPTSVHIPFWLKNVANWWFEGRIDDTTFLNLVHYLTASGIIS